MPNTILEHVEGLADITGSAIASIATGTRTVYISGQVGNTPDGEVLEVCHLVGVAPAFAVLAVRDDPGDAASQRMRTELVPYDAIHRVTIRAGTSEERRIGFDSFRTPAVLDASGQDVRTAEEMLAALAAPPALPDAPKGPSDRRPRGRGHSTTRR